MCSLAMHELKSCLPPAQDPDYLGAHSYIDSDVEGPVGDKDNQLSKVRLDLNPP